MEKVRAYIGLGANVGEARRTLAAAVHALAAMPGASLAGVSRLYVTAPVEVRDQPDFQNAVVALDVPAGPGRSTGTSPAFGAGAGPRAGAGSGAGTGTGAGVATGAGTGSGTGAASGTGTGAGAGVATGAGAASGTGAASGAGTGAGAGAGAGPGAGAASGTGTGAGAGVATGAGTGAGPGAGAGSGVATGPIALLLALKSIERAFGRQVRFRYGPRELDLDLLLFGEQRVLVERPEEGRSLDPAKATPFLEVPHPQARRRLFVLAPLADLAPDLVPPGWDETVEQARFRQESIEGASAARPIARWDAGLGGWVDDRPT